MEKAKMVVAYHEGGLMFAGDETDYAPGWYLYTGEDAVPVEVLEPGTNTPMGAFAEVVG